jgi:catechol 2,3-dioxygenase-like lactoylglutathione lyase family enzyme
MTTHGPPGLVATLFLVVSDQNRSRDWYSRVLGATVTNPRDPVILTLGGATLILNDGGGPTDDKPGITLQTPPDPTRSSAFLNLRVTDAAAVHRDTTARGGQWLTPPIDRGREIRGYLRDPDGHLIEVGQATGR